MMLTEGEPDAPPGMQVQHRREVENPFTGGDLGQIAAPPHVRPLRLAEVPTERVGRLAGRSVPLGGGPAGVFRPGHQVLLGHRRGDGVLTDPPPQIPQVRGDPGRAVTAVMLGEQGGDGSGELGPPPVPR